ncbi:MAG: hypothetical protein P4L46_23405 [Fimbriimonas sp.]|nr:hypothetical protein [Fimbriimonas sp.]
MPQNQQRRCRRGLAIALAGCFAMSAAFADEAGAVRAFNRAKRTEPELFVFLKHMPKGGDLHVHVSGAAYSDYMLDAAIAKGLTFDPSTAQFGTDPSKTPAKQLLTDNGLLYRFLDAASMRGWMGGGQSGHDHFFETFGIFGAALGARQRMDVLEEVIARAKSQNEQYMELMTGVTPSQANTAYFQNLPDSTDMPHALSVLRPRLVKLLQEAKPYLDQMEKLGKRLGQSSLTSPANPMTIRYIWSCNRLSTNDEFFAQAAAGIYLAAHEPRIVAMNMVAPEDHPLSRQNFARQMKIVDFLWQRLGRPNLTLHAGELTPSISPPETMKDRIRKTIEVGHARRIGHGVSIAWEDDAEGLMAKMKKEGIAVEICLSSNESILGVAGIHHPLHLYMAHGVPVFLNTDDEGVSRSTLTLEYVKGALEQGLSYTDLKRMARNAIEYSFLSGESLFEGRDYRRPKPAFHGCRRKGWVPSRRAQALMARSDKLRVQLRLERAFVDFESRFP